MDRVPEVWGWLLDAASILGSILLLLAGLILVVGAFRKRHRGQETAHRSRGDEILWQTCFFGSLPPYIATYGDLVPIRRGSGVCDGPLISYRS